MEMTYDVAMAAGHDAANRNMRKEGRTKWNHKDWNIAADLVARLLGTPTC